MRTSHRALLISASALVLATSAGCIYCDPAAPVGEMVTETSTISAVTAESVTVVVDLNVGDLIIEGGADALLDADFKYNVASWKPEVIYTESGSHGQLTIRQPEAKGSSGRGAECDWHLRFSDEIALTMKIDIGVGRTELDLAGMMLTDLDADIGVGEIIVDLGDALDHDVTIGIDSGVGDIVLHIPERANVTLDCDTGIGSVDAGDLVKSGGAYVTDSPAESDATIRINADIGVGDIRVEDGNPRRQI
ncbi:hypothetical protein KAW64_10930 [bacterium]|nr:hypothetical protein [bacterium]